MKPKPTRTRQLEKLCREMVRTFSLLGWGGRYARLGARYYYERFEKKAKRLGVKGKEE